MGRIKKEEVQNKRQRKQKQVKKKPTRRKDKDEDDLSGSAFDALTAKISDGRML
jgi:hypothetical protein